MDTSTGSEGLSMKILAELLDPRPYWKEGYGKPTTLLLAASVLPTLHFYIGSIAVKTVCTWIAALRCSTCLLLQLCFLG